MSQIFANNADRVNDSIRALTAKDFDSIEDLKANYNAGVLEKGKQKIDDYIDKWSNVENLAEKEVLGVASLGGIYKGAKKAYNYYKSKKSKADLDNSPEDLVPEDEELDTDGLQPSETTPEDKDDIKEDSVEDLTADEPISAPTGRELSEEDSRIEPKEDADDDMLASKDFKSFASSDRDVDLEDQFRNLNFEDMSPEESDQWFDRFDSYMNAERQRLFEPKEEDAPSHGTTQDTQDSIQAEQQATEDSMKDINATEDALTEGKTAPTRTVVNPAFEPDEDTPGIMETSFGTVTSSEDTPGIMETSFGTVSRSEPDEDAERAAPDIEGTEGVEGSGLEGITDAVSSGLNTVADVASGVASGESASVLAGIGASQVLDAVPVVGEVTALIGGIAAAVDGIAHLFEKPQMPHVNAPDPSISNINLQSQLSAKYASAIPTMDSLDKSPSTTFF